MTEGDRYRDGVYGGRQRRLVELDERLAAGEFDLAVHAAGYTGARGAEQQRQAFALAAWAARVGADPADDFDAFVEELWHSVDSLYQVSERVGGGELTGWELLPSELADGDDPPVVWWGEE